MGRGGRRSTTTPCGCPTASSVPLRIHSMIGLLPILPGRHRAAPGGGARAGAWASASPASSRTPACPRPRCAPAGRSCEAAGRRLADPQPAAARPSRAGAPRGARPRTSSCRPTACARSPGGTGISPFQHHHRGRRRRRSTTSPASRRTTCSAATPTGADRSGSRSTSCSSSRSCAGTRAWASRSRSSTRPAPARGCACATSPRTSPRGSCRSGCPTPTATGRSRGATAKLRDDPEWRDLLLFHEYFHGETGAGHRGVAPDRLDRPRRAPAVPRRDAGHRGERPPDAGAGTGRRTGIGRPADPAARSGSCDGRRDGTRKGGRWTLRRYRASSSR